MTSDINVVMQIASGADDPVSRNVTFDGGFTTKDVGFDLGGTYFSNIINRFSLPEEDYDRFQIDLEFKFE